MRVIHQQTLAVGLALAAVAAAAQGVNTPAVVPGLLRPAQVPASAPVQTPAETPSAVPTQTPAETPALTPSQTPEPAASQTPAQTPDPLSQ